MYLLSFLTKFMLPTQSPTAFVADGSFLILIGAIVTAYLLVKYLKERQNAPNNVTSINNSTNKNLNMNINENLQQQIMASKNVNESLNSIKTPTNNMNNNTNDNEVPDYNINDENIEFNKDY